jgi:hypothetical protein
MGDAALIKKLGIKPGQRAVVVNPPDGYADRIGPPQGVEVTTDLDDTFDFVQVSVDNVWSALRFRPFAEVGSR